MAHIVVLGAGIGGAAGLLAGLGLMAIPGIGPVVAAGWLAATAAGAAAGGTGGIKGLEGAEMGITGNQRIRTTARDTPAATAP